MLPLSLLVVREGGVVGLRNGVRPIDPGPLAAELQAYPTGTRLWVQCTIVAGRGVVGESILEVDPGPPKLPPKEEAAKLSGEGEWAKALAVLEAMGDAAVRADAELLVLRTKLFAALDRDAEAIADFQALLAHSAVTARLASDLHHALPKAPRQKLRDTCGRALLAWLLATRPEYWERYAGDVPSRLWSVDVTLAMLEHDLANGGWNAERYFRHAEKRGRGSPRVEAFRPRVEAAIAALAQKARDEAARRVATRPDFDVVERLFGVRLPAALRQAWHASYEVDEPAILFLRPSRDEIDVLLDKADFIWQEHGPRQDGVDEDDEDGDEDDGDEDDLDEEGRLVAVPGSPFPVLPFAEASPDLDCDWLALDLAHPTPDGDFPVLACFHEDEIEELAASSAEWLAEPPSRDRWGFR